jgi:hypothetical protein
MGRPGPWVWLFPLTYLFHAAEELWGGVGFPAWVSAFAGISVAPELFLRLNAMFLMGMVAVVFLARAVPGAGWIVVTLAVSVALNGLLHVAGTLLTRSYSPGVVTGLVLWVPLGLFAARSMRARLSFPVFRLACLGGIGLQAVISMLLLRSGGSR